MRKAFTILGCCALLIWVIFYWYVDRFKCGWGDGSPCSIEMPWSLRGDDFLYLVAVPATVTIGLFAVAWWAGRKG